MRHGNSSTAHIAQVMQNLSQLAGNLPPRAGELDRSQVGSDLVNTQLCSGQLLPVTQELGRELVCP